MIKAWLDATAVSLVKLAARAALIAASALQIMPASAVAQTGGDAAVLAREGIRQGPQGREFYFTIPNTVPAGAKRGDILWMRRREDAPAGIDAWRMIYVTEGVGTKLTYVGGEIYVPADSASGERRVALWNHQTVGNEDACAPSWGSTATFSNPAGLTRVPAINELLKRGYVVVMSDYQGLGTPGGTSYMDGPLDAKASLDAVRAARNFRPARAGNRFVDFGWSQGGQTTLWVASIGKRYSPELDLLGGAPIAPAVNTLGLTLWDIKFPPMGGYLVTTVAGLNISHPELKLRDILTPAGLELLAAMTTGCFAVRQAVQSVAEPVARPEALMPGQPWRRMFDENDNIYESKITTPLLIFQGANDQDVPVDLTRDVVAKTCAQKVPVEYHEVAGRNHGSILVDATPALADWFDARFAGQPVKQTCVAH